MDNTLQMLIAAITAGAAEGAAALREVGVALELDVYSVEAHIDTSAAAPTASVRVDFVVPSR